MPRNHIPFGIQFSPTLTSRWGIPCKNLIRVSLDEVAKEIVLTQFLNYSAIVMVSADKIGGDERQATILVVFVREAHHSMDFKRIAL